MKKTETYIVVAESVETVDSTTHGTRESAESAAMLATAETGGRVFICEIVGVAKTSVNVGPYTVPSTPRKPRADKGKPRGPKAATGPKAARQLAHAPDSFAEAKAEAARREAEGGAS